MVAVDDDATDQTFQVHRIVREYLVVEYCLGNGDSVEAGSMLAVVSRQNDLQDFHLIEIIAPTNGGPHNSSAIFIANNSQQTKRTTGMCSLRLSRLHRSLCG
jgi:hypothetical protein